MDQYYLSDTSQKFLMAQHYHSSLDQPNLDNVEAKLYVARQKNHELAMQYFKNKYGSTGMYEQFVKTHNLGEINIVQSKQQQLRRHLDRKALQIANKYKKNVDEGRNLSEISVEEDEINTNLLKKGTKRASKNPWVSDKKRSSSTNYNKKLDEEDHVFVDNISSYKGQKQTQFINQFKNYLLNKNKCQLDQSGMQAMSVSKLQKTFSNPSIKPVSRAHNKKQTDSSPRKIKNYEEELARKIFRQILKSSFNDQTTVEKIILIEYLVQNNKIIKVLGLSEHSLNQKLMRQYQTQFESHITFQQFLFFILKTVGKEKEINKIKQDTRDKSLPQGCMLSEAIINRFEQIFKKLDIHTDLIVKRMQYVEEMAKDPIIKKQLNNAAVYEEQIDKRVTLRRIFERIQIQILFGTEEEKKIKEYISWNQFLQYFKSKSKDRSKYDIMLLVDTIKKEDKFGLVEVPDIVIDMILQACQKTKREYQEFFNTTNLLNAIIQSPQFEHQKYTIVRSESRISNLPSQTLQQVLGRLKKTAPNYLTIKQLMQYFSARGKPVQAFQQAQSQQAKKNFSGVKVKFAEQGVITRNQNLDGYDSDPEAYNNSQLFKNSPRRSGRSKEKLQTAKSFYEQEKQSKIMNKDLKVTVPKPFSFEQRQKNRNKNKSLQKEHQKEIFQQFKAKQIPSSVLQVGLYERKIQQERKKIEQRKKNSMIMTLASQKPFSFLNRQTKKKTKQQREEFVFKAKPIPWYCSVELLEKKKESEIVRNQKIAKQAQQNLGKAKLPPRMQRDYQQKLAKNAMAEQNKQKQSLQKHFVSKDPPDFDRLHRQFEEGMERKRKQNKTTKPQQFNFNQRTNSRPKTANNLDGFNAMTQQSLMKNMIQMSNTNYKKTLQPKQAATSTLKYTQMTQKRRQQMQQKRKRQQKLKQEQQQRNKVDEELRKKVVSLAKNKENKEKEQRQKRQQQMKEQEKNFKSWKKQRIEKGRQQPMLVERPLKRDEKIQKMRKLYQISETLKSNGIKGKDHDSYFKRDQLLLLQDWQLLKDKIS